MIRAQSSLLRLAFSRRQQLFAEPFCPSTRPEPWDSTMEYGERQVGSRHRGPLYAALLHLPL